MRQGLTRRNALLFFSFLVSPHSGLAQRILDQGAAVAEPGEAGVQPPPPFGGNGSGPDLPGVPAAANVRLRQGLLELLKAAFTAPGSPFAADKFVTGAQKGSLLRLVVLEVVCATFATARVSACGLVQFSSRPMCAACNRWIEAVASASASHLLPGLLCHPGLSPSPSPCCRLLHPLPLPPAPQAVPQPPQRPPGPLLLPPAHVAAAGPGRCSRGPHPPPLPSAVG